MGYIDRRAEDDGDLNLDRTEKKMFELNEIYMRKAGCVSHTSTFMTISENGAKDQSRFQKLWRLVNAV